MTFKLPSVPAGVLAGAVCTALLLGLPVGPLALDLDTHAKTTSERKAAARFTSSTPLTISFQEEVSRYALSSAFVMPGEVLRISAQPESESLLGSSIGGSLTAIKDGVWSWQAPLVPGRHKITITNAASGETIALQVFVMTPYAGESTFNGYRMGRYQRTAKDGDPAYKMPRGLVEVTEETMGVPVSPHFTLGDFICKQDADWPKYVVLKTRLIHKLELLQQEVSRYVGRDVEFHVMSAYRTPYYNRYIGNNTKYSRHLYGDAADVYVDMDEDEWMDDLNGDGRRDTRDAGLLYRVADHLHGSADHASYLGGLGIYAANSHRGPFLHVDTRGSEVSWSDSRARSWLRTYEATRPKTNGRTTEE